MAVLVEKIEIGIALIDDERKCYIQDISKDWQPMYFDRESARRIARILLNFHETGKVENIE